MHASVLEIVICVDTIQDHSPDLNIQKKKKSRIKNVNTGTHS